MKEGCGLPASFSSQRWGEETPAIAMRIWLLLLRHITTTGITPLQSPVQCVLPTVRLTAALLSYLRSRHLAPARPPGIVSGSWLASPPGWQHAHLSNEPARPRSSPTQLTGSGVNGSLRFTVSRLCPDLGPPDGRHGLDPIRGPKPGIAELSRTGRRRGARALPFPVWPGVWGGHFDTLALPFLPGCNSKCPDYKTNCNRLKPCAVSAEPPDNTDQGNPGPLAGSRRPPLAELGRRPCDVLLADLTQYLSKLGHPCYSDQRPSRRSAEGESPEKCTPQISAAAVPYRLGPVADSAPGGSARPPSAIPLCLCALSPGSIAHKATTSTQRQARTCSLCGTRSSLCLTKIADWRRIEKKRAPTDRSKDPMAAHCPLFISIGRPPGSSS